MPKPIHGKKLLDDDDFLVLKTEPFGIQHWQFGNIYVQQKLSGLTAKSTWRERQQFIAIVGRLMKLGVPVPGYGLTALAREYAEAVLSRGNFQWKWFFRLSAMEGIASSIAARWYAEQERPPRPELIRAPIGKILPSLAPVAIERGIPGYLAATLRPGERRMAPESLRPFLIAACFVGAHNFVVKRGFEYEKAKERLSASVQTISGISEEEIAQSLDLVRRFYSSGTIREDHPLDDWLTETLWSRFQTEPYSYPTAMSGLVSYCFSVVGSLDDCILEW